MQLSHLGSLTLFRTDHIPIEAVVLVSSFVAFIPLSSRSNPGLCISLTELSCLFSRLYLERFLCLSLSFMTWLLEKTRPVMLYKNLHFGFVSCFRMMAFRLCIFSRKIIYKSAGSCQEAWVVAWCSFWSFSECKSKTSARWKEKRQNLIRLKFEVVGLKERGRVQTSSSFISGWCRYCLKLKLI